MSDPQSGAPIPFMPCVEPNDAPTPGVLGAESFAYVGQGLSLDQFVQYVQTYDFGPVPPDQLVIHNTANPDASWAPLGTSSATWWDRNEDGLQEDRIYEKRRNQLNAIRDYYVGLGWSSGPHLFFDDRWIWLFTPMAELGTHAKEGNSYHDSGGHLHYTLGIEVVGWYGRVGWPLSIQTLLRGAVQALHDRLMTFEIVYHTAAAHQPAAHQGSIAFHRDYNKPECPGAIIMPDYAIPILAALPIDPLRTCTIGGPQGAVYHCGRGFYDLYQNHGGLALFGYALGDETRDGSDTFMRWERAVAKYSAEHGIELALLSEARDRGWLS